jgi:hypothetical protein
MMSTEIEQWPGLISHEGQLDETSGRLSCGLAGPDNSLGEHAAASLRFSRPMLTDSTSTMRSTARL